jgi:hypothetical protein
MCMYARTYMHLSVHPAAERVCSWMHVTSSSSRAARNDDDVIIITSRAQ